MTLHYSTPDGRAKLYLGDCLNIMPQIPSGDMDLVIADPPYGSGGRDGSVHLPDGRGKKTPETIGNRMSRDSHIWFTRQWARGLFRITTSDAHCYVFSDWRKFVDTKIAFETVGWECRSLIVWDKGMGMGEYWRSSHEFILWLTKRRPRKLTHGGCFNVLRYSSVRGGDKNHHAQKPEGLIGFLIEASSNEGDIVGDPFVGSGTTCVVAYRLGRRTIGIDLKEEYLDMAKNRLLQGVLL